MIINRRTLLVGAAALAAPRVACAATVADDAGREIVVPVKVERVFPATLPAAIFLYTLAPELLPGWPRANRPEQCVFMLPDICERPELGPATPETVDAFKADLIIDVGAIDDASIALARRTQEQTGIPFALLDGRFLSLSTTYEKLGRLTGRERSGLDFADYCNMTLGVITNRIAFVPREKRPRVYFADGPRGLITALGGSSHAETIELIARNVAGGRKGELTDTSMPEVGVWDPDVIVATDRAFAESVRSDRTWANVKAVRENRVHLSPQLPFPWVEAPAGVNRLIGLWWLARIFYPEVFKEDLRELAGDFYAKFYHVTPTAAEIDHVLAGRS